MNSLEKLTKVNTQPLVGDKITCLCGAEFMYSAQNKKFCSKKCYSKFKNLKPQICECGALYYRSAWWQVRREEKFQGSYCKPCLDKNFFRKSKYKVTDASFLDLEFISYFIGFCAADGYLSNDRYIGFCNTDLDVIVKIVQRFGLNENLIRTSLWNQKKNSRYKPIYSCQISPEDSVRIINMGFTGDKETLSIRELLRNGVILYPFLRGFLDGDGTLHVKDKGAGIRLKNLRFLARKQMALELHEELSKLGISSKVAEPCYSISPNTLTKTNNGLVYYVNVHIQSAYRLLSLMYLDSTIHMDRKKELYDSLGPGRFGKIN